MSNPARNSISSVADSTVQHSSTQNFNEKDDKSKIVKSSLYYGNCNDLEDWLYQLKIYYLFDPLPEEKKIMLAVNYLHRKAQH